MAQDKIWLDTLKPEHAAALEQLQKDCFPTLGKAELLRAEHFRRHAELFPEGNIVALVGERVVGLGAGLLTDFDFDHINHSFQDIITGGSYERHDPNGAWYYGTDISVHPQYRRRGVARQLYDARKTLVKRLNKRGIVAGGVLPTFAKYKAKMSVQDYVDKVIKGDIFGQTLSVQLRNGFTVRGLLENYIEDEAADNWATLLVWENPEYEPKLREKD